jgi:hypothetical protein
VDPTSTLGAQGLLDHTAVWSGSKMIVWGGQTTTGGNDLTNSGGIYNPTATRLPSVDGDLSGDGHPDLLWQHEVAGTLYSWRLEGTVTTAGSYLTPSSVADTNWQVRALADFDGDGQLDVLWHHQASGEVYVWLLDRMVATAGGYLTDRAIVDPGWQIQGAGDFNGDGWPDLLWRHQITGDLYAWFLNRGAMVGGSYLTPSRFTDANWQIRGVADFDKDGKPDILWHHQGSGDLYVWGMTGAVVTGGFYLTPSRVADTQWKIVEVADFDKDGKQDLLWHHQGNGDLYVWFLDGTAVTGGSYLTPSRFADANWMVVPR